MLLGQPSHSSVELGESTTATFHKEFQLFQSHKEHPSGTIYRRRISEWRFRLSEYFLEEIRLLCQEYLDILCVFGLVAGSQARQRLLTLLVPPLARG
jgi:hypothetical protein